MIDSEPKQNLNKAMKKFERASKELALYDFRDLLSSKEVYDVLKFEINSYSQYTSYINKLCKELVGGLKYETEEKIV